MIGRLGLMAGAVCLMLGVSSQQATAGPEPAAMTEARGTVEGSLADQTLQADVERAIVGGSAQIVPGCDSARATQELDIWPASVTRAPVAGGPWQEVWTITLCDQSRRLQLDFTPNRQQGGTDFRIRSAPDAAPSDDGKG